MRMSRRSRRTCARTETVLEGIGGREIGGWNIDISHDNRYPEIDNQGNMNDIET